MNLSSKVRQFIRRLQRGTGLPTSTQLTDFLTAPATNPWLAARNATTAIIADAGGQAVRINCILRDGNGRALPNAILKVYFNNQDAAVDVVPTTGTLLVAFNGSDDAGPPGGASIGGLVVYQADASGVVNFATGAFTNPGDQRITLEHLGHCVNATINVT